MIRVLNFLCVVLTAFSCLALNHVSDQTRVAEAQLNRAKTQIAAASDTLKILQADWERASNPAHIQSLAASHLGLEDTATVEVASLELLPRRGETTPLSGPAVTNASIVAPAVTSHLHLVAAHSGE
jgi:cell division protein FtsL